MAKQLLLDFSFLNDWQKPVFNLMKKYRYSMLIVHRRAWKTVLAVTYLIYKALKNDNKDLWYLWPYLNQTKSIAWEYLKKFSSQIPDTIVNNSDLKITFPNWSTIRLFGWDNPDALRWLNLSTIVMDEYADINPELYNKIIFPQINFHWEIWQTIILWTPKWKNHFYKLYNKAKEDERWFTRILDVTKTKALSDELIEEARQQVEPSQFAQEYMCSFEAAVRGSYYKDYIDDLYKEGRVDKDLYDPNFPVTVHMDLWIDDATAIIYTQYIWERVVWIDYDEFNGKGFPFITKLLKDKGYKYDRIYLPWDASVKEFWTGVTRIETFTDMMEWEAEVELVPRMKIEDWINAVRDMFPHLWVDDSLEEQIDRLSMYEAEWNEKKQIFTKPKHNEYSHLADAMRYCATTWRSNTEINNNETYLSTIIPDYDNLLL